MGIAITPNSEGTLSRKKNKKEKQALGGVGKKKKKRNSD